MRPRFLANVCLFGLIAGFTVQISFAASNDARTCPVTPFVTGRPDGTPALSSNRWYANADRTIWVTFPGKNSLTSELGESVNPILAKSPGHKGVWYKPSYSLLTVTGRRIDGDAPSFAYELSDPRQIEPSEINFPSAGCWQIEARAGSAELRLVVLVKPGFLPLF